MGFWKSFFGLEDDSSQSGGKKSDLDTTFVSYSEEREFEESIYGTLQLYSAEVSYIEEVLPERGANLKKQIELLLQLLEKTNDEKDLQVIDIFSKLKVQFEEDKRLADGEYTISELEHQNRIMDSVFDKSYRDNDGISRKKLNEYIDFISKVQKKVKDKDDEGKPILTSVQRQKFNFISMKSEYRIKMLELMYLLGNGEVEKNPFLDLSDTKQKMFSKWFFEDAKAAEGQYEYLSFSEEAFNKYYPQYFRSIDEMAKQLNEQMANAKMIDDFSIRQIFDSKNEESKSFDFLKRFVRFKSTINTMMKLRDSVITKQEQENEKIRQQEEEERKEAERLAEEEARKIKEEQELQEKYSAFTDADIRREIDRIEHDISAKGSRYVNILDFQKRVARAKGLLETEANLKKDGLVYKAVNATEASKIIELANMTGISYAAFPDCQENSDGGFTFVVPKSDSKVLNVQPISVGFNSGYYFRSEEILGNYPDFAVKELQEKLGAGYDGIISSSTREQSESILQLSVGYACNASKPSSYKSKVEKIKATLDEIRIEMDDYCADPAMLQDVLCYISVPATRNIIPILQEFKNANISSYLEPVPEKNRNGNNRNNIQIYFERDELEKFREEVLPRISDLQQGLVKLRWEDKSVGTAIKEELNWTGIHERRRDE